MNAREGGLIITPELSTIKHKFLVKAQFFQTSKELWYRRKQASNLPCFEGKRVVPLFFCFRVPPLQLGVVPHRLTATQVSRLVRQLLPLALRPSEVGSPLRAVATDPLCSLCVAPRRVFERRIVTSQRCVLNLCPATHYFPRTPTRSPTLAGVKISNDHTLPEQSSLTGNTCLYRDPSHIHCGQLRPLESLGRLLSFTSVKTSIIGT